MGVTIQTYMLKMTFKLYFLLILAVPNVLSHCEDVNLSYDFPGIVAHGVHSLTLEMLRHYFDENAAVLNGIPAINPNCLSDELVLDHVPSSGMNVSFKTPAMNAVDFILSHMDNRNFGIKGAPVLEKVVHALHMQESWNSAQLEYKKLVESPPQENVCKCIRNDTETDVRETIEQLAEQVCQPGLNLNNGKGQRNIYRYRGYYGGNAPQPETLIARKRRASNNDENTASTYSFKDSISHI